MADERLHGWILPLKMHRGRLIEIDLKVFRYQENPFRTHVQGNA
jgi:hypothetical protein